jgi:signal transduction histidine kinase
MTAAPLPARRPARVAGLLAALWSVPALLASVETWAFQLMEGRQPAFWRIALSQGSGWYAWAAMTPLVFALARRFPLSTRERAPRGAALLAHTGACVAAALAHAFVYTAVARAVASTPPHYTFLGLFARSAIGWFPLSVLVYVGLVSGGHWRELAGRERERERRTVALESQLARAQLQALRMQLHPHFLFNTLHTIAVLVREQDTETAVRLLARLGDVLREVLRSADAHEVRLRDELAFTGRYLEIEQVRFADRLRVVWRAETAALDAAVPHLVLQPLVENALRHGIARREHAGLLEIGARRDGARLTVWVRDDGPGPGAAAERGVENGGAARDGDADGGGSGIGLANVRARLAALYGDAALRLEPVAAADGGGTRAVLELPWRAGTTPAPVAAPADSYDDGEARASRRRTSAGGARV